VTPVFGLCWFCCSLDPLPGLHLVSSHHLVFFWLYFLLLFPFLSRNLYFPRPPALRSSCPSGPGCCNSVPYGTQWHLVLRGKGRVGNQKEIARRWGKWQISSLCTHVKHVFFKLLDLVSIEESYRGKQRQGLIIIFCASVRLRQRQPCKRKAQIWSSF